MSTITPEMIAAGENVLTQQHNCSPAVLALQVFTAMAKASPAAQKRPRAAKDEPDGFAPFYALYPRHEARRDASDAFMAAILRGSLENLMAGCRRYAEACRGKDPKYIKLPATWLRADCWKDEIPTGPKPSGYQKRFNGNISHP